METDRRTLVNIIYYLVPLLVFVIIWVPVIRHYHISDINITDTMIEKARTIPDDAMLEELNSNEFRALNVDYRWNDDKELIKTAKDVLLGKVPGFPDKITIPFNPEDITKNLPGKQVKMASLFVPDILISAYAVSGRDEFLIAAKDIILEWASYERGIWLPKGMIWNDYAIAARNQVLIKFWSLYRRHPSYNMETAKKILQFALRGGEFLAKPSHFTFSSNHGIIQNLALLRLSLAFPTLPTVDNYRNLAMKRLHDQMEFYINDEGVVFEHSAHYQFFGVYLTGILIRSLTLMDEPVPDEWKDKYEKTKAYFAQIRRPDGSLPMYGDTHPPGIKLSPPVTGTNSDGNSSSLSYKHDWEPTKSEAIYPVSGYSIWWDGLNKWPDEQQLNQTTVIWSSMPGHVHKHADEMSVLLYAGGQTWWTNAGYWTYGTKGREETESWSGSNAPHLVGESYESIRTTELKYYGWSENLSAIDLKRIGPGEYTARRQVIHIKPDLWIIVDNTSGDWNSRTRTIWTAHPEVNLNESDYPGSFHLKKNDGNLSLKTFFITSENTKIDRYKGSYAPFAGWVKNKPAEAFVIEQPANNSWSVAIWSLENAGSSSFQYTGVPYMQNWKSPESWEVVLPVQPDHLRIRRDGYNIYVNKGITSDNSQILKLMEAPAGIADNYNAIRTAYQNAASKYPKSRNLLPYRWKLTNLLVFIIILQEIFFFIYKKRKGLHYTGLRILATIGWISIIGVWQFIVYLKG